MRRVCTFILIILFLTGFCSAQESSIDYNAYYRFPLSIAVEYQNLTPFADYGSVYNIFDISTLIRYPLSSWPVFQPTLCFGMIRFDNQDLDEPLKWDNTHWYGMLGAAYINRFQKNFELGAELMAGASQALFPNLLPEEGTVGTFNLIFESGIRIGLDPSYSISIDIHPNLKYLYSFNYLKDFNGFLFGIGFSASYRLGQDPDASSQIIRSLRFSEVEMPDLFAAMQSYYVDNPCGTITIMNSERHRIENLDISFFQAGYMDTPTPSASIPVLAPGERRTIPLYASFNREIFNVEGITPLTGEVIAQYTFRGRPAEQKLSVTYDLYDKTSIIWDDDRKVSAFITPADSALRNYSSFVRQSCRDSSIQAYSEALQFAVQAYHALGEIGCLYQVDPRLPFTDVQDNLMVVDSISLPRNTLQNISGDCDDLTVLYCSLLETVGVQTAFITIPGHIYAAFNTNVPARDYALLHPDRKMTLNIDGNLWIPVEITLIGKTDFIDAWRKGIEEWYRYENDTKKTAFYQTSESQNLYRPVGLTETDLGLQYGNKKVIERAFTMDMNIIIAQVVSEYEKKAEQKGGKRDYNRLGIVLAQFQRYTEAERAFRKVLDIDPAYLSAQINLGNLEFLQEKYSSAINSYETVYKELQACGRGESGNSLKLLINLSRANYLVMNYEKADLYFNKAKKIDPVQAEKYTYLAQAKNVSSGRAQQQAEMEELIIFIEE